MISETILKTKLGKVVKNTFANGVNVGDYVYIHTDSKGDYVETISNRDTARLNEVIKLLKQPIPKPINNEL